mmetsp:Transcript_16273/g.40078  ORF Transcript_16273/g.40078 Transcript_16273/m.40078 type:complete len:583 (-) Transcript_16273:103-1851(-)
MGTAGNDGGRTISDAYPTLTSRAGIIDAEAARPLLSDRDELISPEISWKRFRFNADWPVAILFLVGTVAWLALQLRALFFHQGSNVVAKAAQRASFWPFFARHPDIPIVLSFGVVGIAVLCVWLLQRHARVALWGLAIFKCLLLTAIGLISHGALAGFCLPLALGIVSLLVLKYKDVNYTAAFLQQACVCLRTHWGIWFASLLFQLLYWLVLFLFVLSQMREWQHQLEDADTKNSFPKRVFASLMLVWITLYLRQAKLMVSSVSTVAWYFTINRPPERPGDAEKASESARERIETSLIARHPAMASLKWCVTSSAGTLALGGFVLSSVQACTRGIICGGKDWCCNCNLLHQLVSLVTLASGKTAEIATRYAMVAHAITGRAIFRSGRNAYTILKGKEMQIIVVQEFGETVVRIGAYLLAILTGLVAWIWTDLAENFGTLSLRWWSEWTWEGFLFFLLALYMITTYYPLCTIITLSAISGWFSASWTPVLMGLFVGSISHMAFIYMAEVIIDAVTAVVFCYSLEKAQQLNGNSQSHLTGGDMKQKNSRMPHRHNTEAIALVQFFQDAKFAAPSAPEYSDIYEE